MARTNNRPPGPAPNWGSWEDAERLRQQAFLERTPAQRLAWLEAALEVAYAAGTLRPPGPPDAPSQSSNP